MISKETQCNNKNKSIKKKVNVQQTQTSKNKRSKIEDFERSGEVEEVHGVRKYPKINVSYQMDDAILLDSAQQLNIFKQKDYVENILSRKVNIAFSLVAMGNHASSYDAKSPVLNAIMCWTKIT